MLIAVAGVRGDRRVPGLDRRVRRRAVVRRHARGLPDLAGRDPEHAGAARHDHHPGPLDQLHRQLLLLARRAAGSSPRSSRCFIRLACCTSRAGARDADREGEPVRPSRSALAGDRSRRLRRGRDRESRQGDRHAARAAALGSADRRLLHRADLPREVDDVRAPRLRRRRERRGGAPRGHQRAADPRARLRDLGRDRRRSAASSSPRR